MHKIKCKECGQVILEYKDNGYWFTGCDHESDPTELLFNELMRVRGMLLTGEQVMKINVYANYTYDESRPVCDKLDQQAATVAESERE